MKPQKQATGLEGRRVLFISYNGMLDPLGQSQVIPYLRQLTKQGVRFTLLSFERRAAFTKLGREKSAELRSQLGKDNIEWHWLRYHQRPSLPATMFDVLAGVRYAQRLVRTNKIELVHARSHIPATIALALKRRQHIKLIFDIRGLMAEEYRDAAHWREGSVPYRLTKRAEQQALAEADGVVTLTERIWPIIREWEGLRGRAVFHEVVPCCADLDHFRFSEKEREQRRRELGLADQFTIVYCGSIDGWYLTREMADFFAAVLRKRPDSHFIWLTPTKHQRVRKLMHERGIAEKDFTIRAVKPAEVPSYLSAADAGLAYIKPCFSKLASSPTKNAEYLACGLPLIINAGIGDSDALVEEHGVGALVTEFSETGYCSALETIEGLVNRMDETRGRARAVAEELFNLSTIAATRYGRLYQNVFTGSGK